jgi:hypothetical protein
MILLNNYQIPGYEQKLSASLSIAGEDMSGQGSSTTQADKGEKAKEVSVSTHIRFIDAKDLTALIAVAEGKNDKDERKIFDIINVTANAMNIRQVQFQGDVQVHEEDKVRAWAITFKLVEYNSVPEKKQKTADKTKAAKVAAQKPTGKTATAKVGESTKVEAAKPVSVAASGSGGGAGGASTATTELSGTEKVLKYLDDKLK